MRRWRSCLPSSADCAIPGRSGFEALQVRAKRRRWYRGCRPVTICAFDLLFFNGRSIMHLPLSARLG